MFSKKSLIIIVIIGLSVMMVSTSASFSYAKESYSLKTIHAWSKTSFDVKHFLDFIEMTQKDADMRYPGELKLDYRGGAEVIGNLEQVEACRRGLIDMVYTAASYYTSIMPEMDIMSLTTMRPWQEREAGVHDYLEKLHNAKANAHFLGRLGTTTLFHLFLNEPVKGVDDFKGMKIRCSPTHIAFMKSLNAEPIGMPPSDIYTAMERGVVAGYVQPPTSIRDLGLVEITKYMLYPGFYEPIVVVLFNLDTWNKLPQHLKDLLTDNIKKAEHLSVEAYQNRIKSELEAFQKEGMTFFEMPPAEAARFSEMAENALFGVVKKKAPEEAVKLRALVTKE